MRLPQHRTPTQPTLDRKDQHFTTKKEQTKKQRHEAPENCIQKIAFNEVSPIELEVMDQGI